MQQRWCSFIVLQQVTCSGSTSTVSERKLQPALLWANQTGSLKNRPGTSERINCFSFMGIDPLTPTEFMPCFIWPKPVSDPLTSKLLQLECTSGISVVLGASLHSIKVFTWSFALCASESFLVRGCCEKIKYVFCWSKGTFSDLRRKIISRSRNNCREIQVAEHTERIQERESVKERRWEKERKQKVERSNKQFHSGRLLCHYGPRASSNRFFR